MVEIGPAKSLKRPSFYDCRTGASDKEGNEPYVMVAFLRNGHPYARAPPAARRCPVAGR